MLAPTRRDFLQLVLGGATLVSVPEFVSAQAPHSSLTATKLTDTLTLITGAGGNVVLATSSEGAVMVNGGRQDRSADLMTMVAQQTGGRRIVSLFNTDWCAEHTGSNETLGKTGAEIIAHENTKQYLANDQFVEWRKRTYKALPPPALPTKTFYTTGKRTLGGERIEYGHLGQAHTDGDIYVFFPDANVLVAGDMLSVGAYPIADYTTGGWLGGMVTATKTLLDMSNAETKVIPGAGPVQTRADLQAQFEMLNQVRERFVKMVRQGMGASDMLAAGITKDFDDRWGSPTPFIPVTYRGMWLHVRELGGIV